VVAEDRQGHPVRGLEAQDFTLLDNGQPRTITDFHAVDTTVTPDAIHVLIVMDMINTGFGAVAREREELGNYLNQDGGKLSWPTSIGILTEDGVKVMNGSTLDGHVLQTQFQKSQTDLRSVGRAAGFYGAAERMELSLRQISELATVEATHPGRKFIVVIGPGWPMLAGAGVEADIKQRSWVWNYIVQLTNGLRQAHIALYSVNAFDFGGRSNPFYYQGYLKPIKRLDNAEYPDVALQVVAEHSGGRAIPSGHDVQAEINTALRDAGPYYQITFESPSPDHPNEFHELSVHIAKPDLTARTNSFYYANPQMMNGNKAVPNPR
jgi:VWFA-related protein